MDSANFKNRVSLIGKGLLIAAFIFGFTAYLAYGDWYNNDPRLAPSGDVSRPIHTWSNQAKQGGILLNDDMSRLYGLLVNCDPFAEVGCVGIGTIPRRDATLELEGNLAIDGVLKIKGNTGGGGDVVTWSDAGTVWGRRRSWLTLMGAPTLQSLACAEPAVREVGPMWPCSDIGYSQYSQDYCAKDEDPTSDYWVRVRVCYKDF